MIKQQHGFGATYLRYIVNHQIYFNNVGHPVLTDKIMP